MGRPLQGSERCIQLKILWYTGQCRITYAHLHTPEAVKDLCLKLLHGAL